MHIKINKNYLTYDKYKVKCALGKRGIGTKRMEGDKITPIGRYNIKFLLYRKDRIKKIKTKLKKIIIKKNMGWCDDVKSKFYNKEISFPFKYNAEKLYRKNNIYDLVINIKYNQKPIIKGKGSAIFLHITNKKYKSTKGCIAIKKNDFLEILPKINKKTKIIIN